MDALGLHLTRHGARAVLIGSDSAIICSSRVEVHFPAGRAAVAAHGDLLIEPVRQECAHRLPPATAERFRCEIFPLAMMVSRSPRLQLAGIPDEPAGNLVPAVPVLRAV